MSTITSVDMMLNEFVSNDELRPNLLKPYSDNRFTFASNGHCLIRIPKINCNENPEGIERILAFSQNIINNAIQNSDIKIPVKTIVLKQILEAFPRENIYETKLKIIECPECNGEGESECKECGNEYICHECDGRGYIEDEMKTEKVIGTKYKAGNYLKIYQLAFNPANIEKILKVAEFKNEKTVILKFISNANDQDKILLAIINNIVICIMAVRLFDDSNTIDSGIDITQEA